MERKGTLPSLEITPMKDPYPPAPKDKHWQESEELEINQVVKQKLIEEIMSSTLVRKKVNTNTLMTKRFKKKSNSILLSKRDFKTQEVKFYKHLYLRSPPHKINTNDQKFEKLLTLCTAEIYIRLLNHIRGVRTHTPAVRKLDNVCAVTPL